MTHLSEKFKRAWRVALGGSAALCLVLGCPPPGRGHQAAVKTPEGIREGIRKGSLFYAVAPLSEQALRRLDGTPTAKSFTVPLTVDRVHNRLLVEARMDGRKVRLILDTAGGPDVALDEATARGITLAGKVSTQMSGSQGTEPVALGLARRLTLGTLTLGGIATTVSRDAPFYSSTLGIEIFMHYRVTLDFAAKTMTLTRGGIPTVPSGGRLGSCRLTMRMAISSSPSASLAKPVRPCWTAARMRPASRSKPRKPPPHRFSRRKPRQSLSPRRSG